MLCYSRGLNLGISLEKSHSLVPPCARPTAGIPSVFRKTNCSAGNKLKTAAKVVPVAKKYQEIGRKLQGFGESNVHLHIPFSAHNP